MTHRFLPASCGALILALIGCGGGSGNDYRVSANPLTSSIEAGRDTTGTVTVTRIDPNPINFAVAFTVAGCPAGVTCQFNQSQMSLGSVQTRQSTRAVFLNIRTQPSAVPGSYPLSITSSGGGVTRTTSATLVVTAAPSFDLDPPSPSLRIIDAAETTTYTITVIQQNGTAGPVTLSLSGCPAGTTCSFSPAVVTPTAAGVTSTLTVATTLATPVGRRTLTITATGQGVTRTETALLNVRVPGQVIGEVCVNGRMVPISIGGPLCLFVGTTCRYDVFTECGCRLVLSNVNFPSVNDLEEAIAHALEITGPQVVYCTIFSGVSCPCNVILDGAGYPVAGCPSCPICFTIQPHRC